MELQSPGLVADAVGLVAAMPRPGEMHGAGRQLAGVRMPLEDVVGPPLEMAEQPVLVRGGERVQPVPADLRHRVGMHVRAHRGGQQLRAEADAEHGLVRVHGLADHRHLGEQVGVQLGLVDVHRSAEHDDAVVTPRVRFGLRLAAEVDVADTEAAVAQQRIEVSEGLGGDVL